MSTRMTLWKEKIGRIHSLIWGHFDKYEKLEIALFFLLGLVVFLWVPDGMVVDSFDGHFSYDPSRSLDRMRYLWDDYGGIGTHAPRNIPWILPNGIYYYLSTEIVGASLHWSQMIMFYLIMAGSGISMFFLYRAVGLGEEYKHGAFVAGLLYMFSPIAAMFLWNQLTTSYYSFVFIPLMGALAIQIVKRRANLEYVFLLAGLWTVLISSSYTNPVNALMDWFFITTLILFLALLAPNHRKRYLLVLTLLFICWALINLYWLLPTVLAASTEYMKADVEIIGISNEQLLWSNTAPFSRSFLQTGYWALTTESYGDSWYSWASWAATPYYVFGLMTIALLSWSSLMFHKTKKILIYFGALALFSMIMINGPRDPVGDIFLRPFQEVPFLYSLRSLYQKFGPLLTLSYSVMAGFVLGFIIRYLVNNRSSFPPIKMIRSPRLMVAISIGIVFSFSLGLVAVPYLTGDVIYRGGDVIPSALTVVPDYYYDANDWLVDQGTNYRMFALPYCVVGYSAYKWEHGLWSGDPTASIFNNVIISNENGEVNEFCAGIAEGFAAGHFDYDVTKVLTMMNVRYIMLHEDMNWEFIAESSWWVNPMTNFTTYHQHILSAGFIPSASFGGLHLYENPHWVDCGFYQTNTLVEVDDNEELYELTMEDWFQPASMAVIYADDAIEIRGLLDHVTIVNYSSGNSPGPVNGSYGAVFQTEATAVRHDLNISSNGPLLVFSQRYHEGWRVSNEGAVHFQINMFFNGYLLNNPSNGSLSLEYEPHSDMVKTLYLGYGSAVFLGISIVILRKKYAF